MRKIGIATLALLAAATSACAGSPTAATPAGEASMNGFLGGSGNYEEESTSPVSPADETGLVTEGDAIMVVAERNPGFGGSGN